MSVGRAATNETYLHLSRSTTPQTTEGRMDTVIYCNLCAVELYSLRSSRGTVITSEAERIAHKQPVVRGRLVTGAFHSEGEPSLTHIHDQRAWPTTGANAKASQCSSGRTSEANSDDVAVCAEANRRSTVATHEAEHLLVSAVLRTNTLCSPIHYST